MNKLLLRLALFLTTVSGIFFWALASGTLPENPFLPYAYYASGTDTIPLQDRQGDFLTDPNPNPFNLQDPELIEKKVEYDPETNTYIITETIGGEFYRMPTYMTFEEYLDWRAKQQEQEYFQELAGLQGSEDISKLDPIAKVDIQKNLVDRLFGDNTVSIRPQGNIDLTFGLDYQNVQNPALIERQRKITTFDFDMGIQMNVEGSIGKKLRLSTNYNSQATFNFDNVMKLDYNTDLFGEDDIIKNIEVGNVSLPLRGSLIQGAQSLLGIKTELQFGHLWLTAVASQQKSERKQITIQGGSEYRDFQLRIDEYDENRHFFLSHYNRNVFEKSLENMPQIKGLFRIQKIQVWITNDRGSFENVRDVVALTDLGEPNGANMTNTQNPAIQPPLNPKYLDISGQYGLPDNAANPLLELIQSDPNTSRVDRVVSSLQAPPLSLRQGLDFEKITARQLSPSEFTYHPELGFISVNINVQPDQVLAVAYQYTYKDSVYQVGQFADDIPAQGGTNPGDQEVIFLKMLKSATQRVDQPSWDLMMKNIYSIGAYQVNPQDFQLDIYYEEPGGGQKRFLPDTKIKGIPLLNIFQLDRLNSQLDPQPDGVFDFVQGITINPTNGRIMFPVLEPFGKTLAEQIDDPQDSVRYVYQQLYDSTKTRAQEFAYLNRFIIKGNYKTSISNEISLGAFNLPPGSVNVTAGGKILEEGRDYEIDYTVGRIKILNEALLASGAPINVSFEDNNLFGFQTKTLLGLRADYRFSDQFNIGATYMHLFERPFTQKVNIGEDPINNRIFGLDITYSSEAPWITRIIDGIPLIQTKAPSQISFTAEGAYLKPGHSKAINQPGQSQDQKDKGGVVYVDDFEGSVSSIPLYTRVNAWVLASVPQDDEFGNNPYFPEGKLSNNRLAGVNRAHLSWYRIDQGVQQGEQSPYTMQIDENEIFPNLSYPNSFGQVFFQTFDLTYYPNRRGSYNFDLPEGTPYSAGLNIDGTLKAPESRWAGIMTNLSTNDFQAANVEYIEFWVLSPFLNPDGSGAPVDDPENYEGEIYFNLGNISEDILKDSRLFFENGLPTPDEPDADVKVVETAWGRVPTVPRITNAFDADPEKRVFQDIGLDGLSDQQERAFYADYLQALQTAGIANYQEFEDDPAFDDYIYYNDPEKLPDNPNVLQRYFRFNLSEGNTPTSQQGQQQTTFGRIDPDMEDVDKDFSLNETESYFQYRIPIRYDGYRGIDMENNPFVTDSITSQDGKRVWYRFKIPLQLNDDNPYFSRVGGIQDFRSIRFVRLYLRQFKKPVTFRFARLELVRNQWRRYQLPSGLTSIGGQQEENSVQFDVDDVNFFENAERTPFGYILPPGIIPEQALGVNLQATQNEQALSLNVCGLPDNAERSIYKLLNMDFRLYKGLKMFVHAESIPQDPYLEDKDLHIFIRFGSDFSRNYYEYEMPLTLSDPDLAATTPKNSDAYPFVVWPEANNVEILFELLKELKIMRNQAGIDPGAIYPLEGYVDPNHPEARLRIKGNPNLGEVKGVMIGIRNPKDDNLDHCAEVWVNELRLFGLDEQGGGAATARLDIQLADLGNLSVAGSYSSIGFGALDQNVIERSREQVVQWDVATNIALDKFFPSKWGLRLPLYMQWSQTRKAPQYDPFDLDIPLQEKIATSPADQRDSIRNIAQDITSFKTVSLTNVRKERSRNNKKPKPWDISNLSATYAYSETERSNPLIESDKERIYHAALDYNYSRSSKFITPLKGLSKSKHLKLITGFNFNPLPNSFGFSTLMDRQISVRKYRFTGDPQYATFYNKRWNWDRNYNLNWDLAKGIKLNFNAVALSVIDEPDGLIDTPEKKEIVLNNIRQLGRNKSYNHNINISYTAPFKLIPLLDWINVRASYNATYAWNAASLTALSLGNVIQNTQQRTINADLSFDKLYNKSAYLKRINTRQRPSNRRGSRSDKGKKTTRPNAPARPDAPKGKKTQVSPWEKAFIRPLLLVRKMRFSYSENFGTVVPGYLPGTEFLGMADNFLSPGWDFIAGLQPNIRPEDYYGPNDWLYNNWNWISRDLLLNQQVTQDYSQSADARLTLEPFPDFRIELTATRSFSRFQSEDFRRDTIFFNENDPLQSEYKHLNNRQVGSFTTSYSAIKTLFSKDIQALFQQFEDNRLLIAHRLAGPDAPPHADSLMAALGYPQGYGRTHQSVLLPSFIAAYTEQDPNTMPLAEDYTSILFKTIPKPNWTIQYNGLSKLPFFKDIFDKFDLRHGYNSSMTVNTFQSDLLYDNNNPQKVLAETQDYITRFELPNLVISEQFTPLLGISMEFKNNMAFNLDFKKARNLQMSFVDFSLNETKNSEYTIGFRWRLSDVNIGFLTGKKKGKGKTDQSDTPFGKIPGSRGGVGGLSAGKPRDLTINFDFSLRDDVTIRYLLDQPVEEPTRGATTLNISPYLEYQLNKQLALRLFFDYRHTEPKTSQSYPITNASGGVVVRFTLQ